ncbi:unnamed protein product [Toxocara canis]|uniref:Pepsin-I3 domain-containing protein n=1 Tax=Toxocara canis TaxID=6265 RepID=A0A183UM15_TOXCA|nr:unnamed protein product [Toxocara canis]
MDQKTVTLASHIDDKFASICTARAELKFVKIFISASFVGTSLALPAATMDSASSNCSTEYDEFEELGCKVVNGTKLFFDETFIRELNEDEQKENEKYEKDMKAFEEAIKKADHNGEAEYKLDVIFPEMPKFCDGLDKVDLGDCYALGGKLYKDNKKLRDLSEKEKKEVDDYLKILEKYVDDAYAKWDENFDLDKVMAGSPKGPKLCN